MTPSRRTMYAACRSPGLAGGYVWTATGLVAELSELIQWRWRTDRWRPGALTAVAVLRWSEPTNRMAGHIAGGMVIGADRILPAAPEFLRRETEMLALRWGCRALGAGEEPPRWPRPGARVYRQLALEVEGGDWFRTEKEQD